MPGVDFNIWASAHQERFENILNQLLPSSETTPRRLHSAMRYSVLGGGKRVRPLLAFAAGDFSACAGFFELLCWDMSINFLLIV